FLDLNQKHSYYSDLDDPFEVLWVHFDGLQAEDYFHLLEGNNSPVYQVHNPIQTQALFRQLYDLFKLRQVGLEAQASAIITHILTNIIVSRMKGGSSQPSLELPTYPKPIRKAIYYIEY